VSTTPAYWAAQAACAIAVVTHLYIFTAESILFGRPAVQRMFDVAPHHAPAVRLWAFHQGVYNLLLALGVLAGVVAAVAGATTVAVTLEVTGSAAMVIAAVTLIAADPRRARLSGLIAQGGPALAVLAALAVAGRAA
jgi:putative membrane protein